MSRRIRFGFCGWSICAGKAELRTQRGGEVKSRAIGSVRTLIVNRSQTYWRCEVDALREDDILPLNTRKTLTKSPTKYYSEELPILCGKFLAVRG